VLFRRYYGFVAAVILEHLNHFDEVSFHFLRKLAVDMANTNPNVGSAVVGLIFSKIPVEINSNVLASEKTVFFSAFSLNLLLKSIVFCSV
jgi:hypothetical protein